MLGNSRIRVLYVNPFCQAVSGPDESLLGILKGLHEIVDPFVLIPPKSPHLERYRSLGAHVIEHPILRIRRARPATEALKFGSFLLPQAITFRNLMRRHKIELVHTNMEVVLQSGIAARMARVPSVYHVRGTSFSEPKRVGDAVVYAINKLADEIIVISNAVGQIFIDRGIRGKVAVVPNTVSLNAFDNTDGAEVAELRRALGGAEGPLIGSVARINPRKGLHYFVRAAARVAAGHPTARFAVVGDAADDGEQQYLEALRNEADSLGIGNKIVFASPRRNIGALMKAIDLFAITSTNEGFGRVVIEAMAAGRAVVASNVGGIPEIVQDAVTGILVSPANSDEIASAISALVSNPQLCLKMGSAGRRRVENYFTEASDIPLIMKSYERVLGARKRITL